jgi:hypothetical protein
MRKLRALKKNRPTEVSLLEQIFSWRLVLILTALEPLFPGLLRGGPTFPHRFRDTFASCGRHPTSFLRPTRC